VQLRRVLEMKPYHAEDPAPATLSVNLNFPGSPPGLSVIYNVTGASLLECDSIANVPATTADHVVENVVGGLNLIRILRVDDEIVESRKSARAWAVSSRPARAQWEKIGFRIGVDENIRAERFGISHSRSSRGVLERNLQVSGNLSDE